jgi:predicted protein tyrosine phosphatase
MASNGYYSFDENSLPQGPVTDFLGFEASDPVETNIAAATLPYSSDQNALLQPAATNAFAQFPELEADSTYNPVYPIDQNALLQPAATNAFTQFPELEADSTYNPVYPVDQNALQQLGVPGTFEEPVCSSTSTFSNNHKALWQPSATQITGQIGIPADDSFSNACYSMNGAADLKALENRHWSFDVAPPTSAADSTGESGWSTRTGSKTYATFAADESG